MTTLSFAPKGSIRSSKESDAMSCITKEDGQSQRQHHYNDLRDSEMTVNINSHSSPIRHAGRALVRGKFRRVWRARYLEVLDTGLVRYYEVAPPTPSTLDAFVESSTVRKSSTSTTTDDNNTDMDYIMEEEQYYHSKIPKCTLWIHHARIIDVTTLRDMHVGLPRGSFGFLFNGHRIMDEENAEYYEEADTLRDNIQLFTMGQACQGGNIINLATPRDFLCAVNSLEEAQSWVIALQWAASVGRESSYNITTTATAGPYSAAGMSKNESWESMSIASSLTSPRQQQQQQQTQEQSQQQDSTLSTISKPKPKQSKSHTTSSSSSSNSTTTTSYGKMVVTKVVGYTVVRVETWKWDFAYQIQVLLVMPTTKQRQQVQEWTILRTATDLEHLVEATSNKNQKIQQQQQMERIASLPQLHHPTRHNDTSTAVSMVDGILRSLCMEATVVNSSAMKRFLGLRSSSSSSSSSRKQYHDPQKPSLWDFHSSTGLVTSPKRTILHQSIDQYVKQWLQQRPKQQQQQQRLNLKLRIFCWYLRLPQPMTTYAGIMLLSLWVSVSILPPLNRFIRKFQILPYISLRADILVLSWLVAAGIGRWLAQRGHNHAVTNIKSGVACSGRRCSNIVYPTTTTTLSAKTSPTKSTTISSSEDKEEEETMRTISKATGKSGVEENEEMVADEEVEDDGEEENDEMDEGRDETDTLLQGQESRLSSPLPRYSVLENVTQSCWSNPKDRIFNVRGPNYLNDRVKIPSGNSSFTCEGVDVWMTDNAERHIARHPSVLGGRLANTDKDMFLVNFLLPFGNFVSYFSIPPLEQFANPQLAGVWTRFIEGDQQYRDARLKLLPVVVDGPWIVRAAVPGTSPALLGKVIPLQYFFTKTPNGRSVYEVDVIITASKIAKGILSVVKGHAKALSIAFAFIIEAAEQEELPETVLASFQVNSLHLEDCPLLPDCNLDAF